MRKPDAVVTLLNNPLVAGFSADYVLMDMFTRYLIFSYSVTKSQIWI